MSEHLTRAQLLVQQGRWDLAERELRQALAEDSQNAEAHYLLALCLLQKKDYDAAQTEAQMAIHLAPEEPTAHYVLGHILYERRHYEEATAALEESLRLNPYQSSAFAMIGQIALAEKRWQHALDAVDQGLAIEPEDIQCTNLRAIALVKLGRRPEAGMTIDAALARGPEVALTHANQGWALLHEGEPKPAMEHFREALRLDPSIDWARMGIVEALKAKNFLYRWLLRYLLFMSRLSTRTQWILVLVLFLGNNYARGVAAKNPDLAPYIMPVLYAYALFVLFGWLGYPLFNLLLFTDKFGRYALSEDQRRGAICVGSVLAAAIAFGIGAWVRDDGLWGLTALNLFLLSLPTAGIFVCPEGWPRRLMLGVTLGLGALGLLPFVTIELALLNLLQVEAVKVAVGISNNNYVIGIVLSQFLVMVLANVTVRR